RHPQGSFRSRDAVNPTPNALASRISKRPNGRPPNWNEHVALPLKSRLPSRSGRNRIAGPEPPSRPSRWGRRSEEGELIKASVRPNARIPPLPVCFLRLLRDGVDQFSSSTALCQGRRQADDSL